MLEVEDILQMMMDKVDELNCGQKFYISKLVPPVDWNNCDQKVVGTKFRSLVLNQKLPVEYAQPLMQRSTPALYVKL